MADARPSVRVPGLMLLIPGWAYRYATVRHLAPSQPPEAVRAIWRETRDRHGVLKAHRPRHSLGVNQVLRLMLWATALYQTLRERGMTSEEAGGLVESINWSLLRGPITMGFSVSRIAAKGRSGRIRWLLDMMFRFAFTRPFRREVKPSAEGLAFDVQVCPLADYFASEGVPELTRHAACRLDYRMARCWGATLHRTHTIAKGSSHCDFRFTIKTESTGPRPAAK